MKNYDPNIERGIHTVKITIQQWDYVGHIFQKISGNCRGRDILDFDFWSDSDDLENDCQLSFDDESDYFFAILENENGGTLEVDGDAEDFNNMIVAVEIIDFSDQREEQEHEQTKIQYSKQ